MTEAGPRSALADVVGVRLARSEPLRFARAALPLRAGQVVAVKSADPAQSTGEVLATVVVGSGQLTSSAVLIDPTFMVVGIASTMQIQELGRKMAEARGLPALIRRHLEERGGGIALVDAWLAADQASLTVDLGPAPNDLSGLVAALTSSLGIPLNVRRAGGLSATLLPYDWDAWLQPPSADPTVAVQEPSPASPPTAGSFIQRLFPPGIEPIWGKRRPRSEGHQS